MAQKSWFSNLILNTPRNSESSQRICSPSTPFSFVVCKENAQQPIEDNAQESQRTKVLSKSKLRMETQNTTIRALPIKLNPTKEEKFRWRRWLGWCRIVYNLVISDFKASKKVKKLAEYRELVLNHTESEAGRLYHMTLADKDKKFGIHWNTLDQSIKEAIQTLKTGVFTNGVYDFKFKTKKQPTQTIGIRAQNVLYNKQTLAWNSRVLSKNSVFQFGEGLGLGLAEKRKKNNHWPNPEGHVLCDSKMTYDKATKTYRFMWSYEVTKPDVQDLETQEVFTKVVSLDPGISPFVAWYAPNTGEAGKIGTKDQARLVRLLLHVDKLQSKAALEPRRKNKSRITNLTGALVLDIGLCVSVQ